LLRWGRVEVTGGFLLVMAWLNYADTQALLPLALCACAAHELGHWAAVKARGGTVSRLRLTAAGAELRLGGAMSYPSELLCTLAGPAVNLLLAGVSARLGWLVFAGVNLALGCFNLLPVGCLDGGRAVYCVLALLGGPEVAGEAGEVLDRVLVCLLLIAGGLAVRAGGSFTLLLVALWMACAGKNNPVYHKKGLPRGG